MVFCAVFGKWIDWYVDVCMYVEYGVRGSEKLSG
jgi:hypothetical protein